jgi:hypothetical protein
MRQILHIVTKTDDKLAKDIIAAQHKQGNCSVNVVDLTAKDPDYDQLLDEIFQADSIQVW